ncbi:nucleotide sugar dehydrogenase [Tumebacillus permanentifrigoris]|uniref:UDP-N-acetyl-D-galactosamine dehydrogenase n=1 Tax=Tumebacillus permanentifrigoris TaxID=378543 RepID=A0A316D613_9BACL|nr:nucleotide sugar dehydrogenase [Tumebacillus permanentifrigoris]PWK09686.1 UDP-N-acetyl-D-galactosamine dehydrogenase [Tumebacillus permanentifrigoris]
MREKKVGVVGLGYVGLPVALAFGEKWPTVGFDVYERRVNALSQFLDENGEHSVEELQAATNLEYTYDPTRLSECEFIIVAVPTPIDEAKKPDLTALRKSSETVGKHMSPGTVVVYESTVYPGTTEEYCVPVLESASGLVCGVDFFVGYSPERINPGDHEHTFTNIVKVVSGQNEDTLNIVADMYGSVVQAGVFRAGSIKVAEAAKVIENTQRDLNIALMNELAMIFDRLGIDTRDVLDAARTKWNFLPFTPGLVGGHCIGVDPYYLTHKAESIGYHPQVILAGRRINDNMGRFIATSLVKQMANQGVKLHGSCVTILGLTFKENVSDLRNSKVVDIVRELEEFGVNVSVHDPLGDPEQAAHEFGVNLVQMEELPAADAVVYAVSHRSYGELGWAGVSGLLKNGQGVVVDLKHQLDPTCTPDGIQLWRL